MKSEIREILLDCTEFILIEDLSEGSRTIPVRDFPFGLQRVEQMEDMRSERRHSGTATDIYHFSISVLNMEFTIGA